ncbi:MAG: mannose-6-phosphate isomerase, class I [Actinobacteria bacterium]|nr:mannose-6-phosphate isomerase, class I [Actinomycetota bacterium]
MTRSVRLRAPIRDYAWGSTSLLATMRGSEPTKAPEAEMWLGAHPGAPSMVETSAGELRLDDYISSDPMARLGRRVHESFGRLPFLMKLLAAGRPLSLQAHPTVDRARSGFERENAAGIPIDAAHRCYKDDNHKPELICALTPFRALAGFREPLESVAVLSSLDCAALRPAIEVLASEPGADDLATLLRSVLTLPTPEAADLARSVSAALDHEGDFPAVRSVGRFIAESFPDDPGVVTALLLNTIELAPGEAIYLGAGLLHAYIDGLGVEIMAASDNVLRGGLTPKHIDVDELVGCLEFVTGPVELVESVSETGAELRYITPAPEFELACIDVAGSAAWVADGPEILVVTDGNLTVDGDKYRPTDSAFLASGVNCEVTGHGTVYVARVPRGTG